MNKQDVKEKILKAAQERFGRFGFNKTTMAEIARDCHMSAGNIYRYFKSKEDIAMTIARTFFSQLESEARQVIRESDRSYADRFEAFILTVLRHTYHHFAHQPEVGDFVAFITKERWDEVMDPHKRNMRALLSELLMAGQNAREFDIDDVRQTADSIEVATKVFEMPQYLSCFSLEKLEPMASGVAQLILHGIRKHQDSHTTTQEHLTNTHP